VADDNKKEETGEEAKKKKGMSPVIMIALGAIIGGVGVVFAVPPKTETIVAPPPEYEEVHITHPDLIKHAFNPRQRAGKGVMKISFKFVYTVTQDKTKHDVEHAAFEQIKQNWDRANSAALQLLRSRSYEELNSESGATILEHDMLEELTQMLFKKDLSDGQEPIARVTELIWKDWLTQ
tara:strand:- start:1515 stop:2051 length:537 start_codon:yes stop_codon:yes gene_type:complete